MSDEPSKKKPKMDNSLKKPNYYMQKGRKHFIEPGHRGFLATCNYREKDCIRECYNILNQYADEIYGPHNKNKNAVETKEDVKESDIADDLQQEINATKLNAKSLKYRFQVVDTGANNCLFIRTTLENPTELGHAIAKDISEGNSRKTRHLLRLVPIEAVCRANIKDIIDSAGTLFDQYFLKESKTFSVAYNKRHNNDIKRDDIIKELAELVASKNIKNKVDLKNAEITVVVEIIKGLCCLSVVPHYLKYKKYNLSELAANRIVEKSEPDNQKDEPCVLSSSNEKIEDCTTAAEVSN